jgi:hypothetical protein
MEPYTLTSAPDVGGMHSAPVLGEAGAVAADHQMRWLELIRSFASSAAQALFFGLLAVVALTLILFDRSDPVYLWMGALFLLFSFYSALLVIGVWTELQSLPLNNLLLDGLAQPLIYAAWVMVFWVWFGLQRPHWLPRLTAVLTLLLAVSYILGDEVFFGLVPHGVAVHFLAVSLMLRLLFFALLLWVVIEGIRRQGVEGWLVLPVVVLRGINAFTTLLSLLHIRMYWFPFGAEVDLGTFANLLVALVIALLLLRRLLQSVKRQRLMALDVKQAQEVQQVILPEARLALPGLTIESEYRPAREVGGDFFQIIPHKSDGSLLIVAGDVTGKGLQAGMLVALLVGAIRTAARFTDDPVVVGWLTIVGTGLPFVLGLLFAPWLIRPSLAGPSGNRISLTIILAVGVAVTSVPVVSKIFADLKILHTRFARLVATGREETNPAGPRITAAVQSAFPAAGGQLWSSAIFAN